MKLNESNFFFSVRKKKRSLKEMKLGSRKKKRNFYFSKKKELSGEQQANSRK